MAKAGAIAAAPCGRRGQLQCGARLSDQPL
jgi:hypothetical protein